MTRYRVYKARGFWWFEDRNRKEIIISAPSIEEMWWRVAYHFRPVPLDPGALRAI